MDFKNTSRNKWFDTLKIHCNADYVYLRWWEIEEIFRKLFELQCLGWSNWVHKCICVIVAVSGAVFISCDFTGDDGVEIRNATRGIRDGRW